MKIFKKNLLLFILIFAVLIRFNGINWDSGFNLHPDERAILLFTIPLQLPSSISDFFSPESHLNPHFFAYGSAPIYLLRIVSYFASFINPLYENYSNLAIIGRSISIVLELVTIILIVRLGKKVFNENIGIIAAFLYTCSVLAIQISHFYTVDTPLTTVVTATLLLLVYFYEKPKITTALFIGFLIGLGLAIKNSALVLLSSVSVALAIDFMSIFLKKPHHFKIWTPHLPLFIKKLCVFGLLILLMIPISFFIFEPYAFISFSEFWQQTLQQYQMTHNAFTFPYTLQYVGKIPYLYEIINIFLWGQGPVISSITIIGSLVITYSTLFKKNEQSYAKKLILIAFFWTYFGLIGNFSIGFMRYLLPIYPLFCLFGAAFVYTIYNGTLIKKYVYFVLPIFILGVILWPLSFIHIYSTTNTRSQASEWIHTNISSGKTLALEHWDDGLPLSNQQKYIIETLELYNADTPEKWTIIKSQLAKTDYIIIASNRLYVPLQKLTDCSILPQNFCYSVTAHYYKNLFDEKLGFKKVAEFSTYPTIPFTTISIFDDNADESFTVYDHPRVIIFKKM